MAAFCAACKMCLGGEKSGWPMPRFMMAWSWADNWAARSETAKAPSSLTLVMLGLRRRGA